MDKCPSSSRLSRFIDQAAAAIITCAGMAVIVTLAAMPALMLREAAPLFLPASREFIDEIRLPEEIKPEQVAALAVAADLSGRTRTASLLLTDGRLGFVSQRNGGSAPPDWRRLPGSPAAIRQAEDLGEGKFSLFRSDDTLALALIDVEFKNLPGEAPAVQPMARQLLEVDLNDGEASPAHAMLRGDENAYLAVAVYADGTVREKRLVPAKGLLARGKGAVIERKTRVKLPAPLSAAVLNRSGERLYLGTSGGDLITLDLTGDPESEVPWDVIPAFRDRRAVTALAFLSGNYSLAAGDSSGGISVWFPRREGGEFRLRQAATWPVGGEAVARFTPCLRDRSFFARRRDGSLDWLHSTTGNELARFPAPSPGLEQIALNSRGDNLLLLRSDGGLEFQRLDSAYPETGWRGFFRRLLYEGHERPAFIWQSSGPEGGEPKLSLVPLIWGSVKAAVFALLFAT
ncbi:MAG: hypothetical protein LBU23_06310, partial [Planctomycetota bacterium]|nr:hypothetical protein [Planctomycetota bacterium]